jgi:hypothetical protein
VLRIDAAVDQNFQQSINPSDVQPAGLFNNPQTHFSKLRLNKNYNFTHNGHFVTGAVSQIFSFDELAIRTYGLKLDINMMYVA